MHGAGTCVTMCDMGVTATKWLHCLVLVVLSLLCITRDNAMPSVWASKQKWVDSLTAGAWSDGIRIKVHGWLLAVVLTN